MDRQRAALKAGMGFVALVLAAGCGAATDAEPAAAPITVTATVTTEPTAEPSATPTATKATAAPSKPVGLLSKPPTTKPKIKVTIKPTVRPTTKKPPTTKPTQRVTTTKPKPSVYYANCTAVRAAGAAPIHRGEPGYSSKLDRDGDGVACEN
jgi:outer membrane biosynthesis protein TonB